MKTKSVWKEIKELGLSELKIKENDLRKELLNLRFDRASHQLKNPLKLRSVRRDIARVLTVVKERERESGGKRK
ncbi:MAG: 50S ribosomal protein L29 [Candidatus Margulisiibacteriota bacterium]